MGSEGTGRSPGKRASLRRQKAREAGNTGSKSTRKDWGVHTVADGQLITGQNPASSGPAAKLLIDTLNKKAK